MPSSSCLFCRIAEGEAPARIVRSTPDLLAFRDIHPRASTHILIIPRKHISAVSALVPEDAELVGKLFLAARELAEEEGIAARGFRMVINDGQDAGQSVFHLHLHLLGGRRLGWPPG